MKVLLAGATGFIGSHTEEALLNAGHHTIRYGSPDEGADAVVNCAGRLGGPGVTEEELRESNLRLPLRLGKLSVQRGIPLVHLSTPGVCGLRAGGLETDEYAPEGPYEETKALAERELLGSVPGVTILRPDFVFGRGDMHKYPLFRQVSRGWFPLVGTGGAKTRPTDVRDVAAAVLHAMPGGKLHGGIFNIGGPDVITVSETASVIAGKLGGRVLKIPVPRLLFRAALMLGPFCPGALSRSRYRLFGSHRFVNTEKAQRAGFSPSFSFSQTASEAVSWYRERGLL